MAPHVSIAVDLALDVQHGRANVCDVARVALGGAIPLGIDVLKARYVLKPMSRAAHQTLSPSHHAGLRVLNLMCRHCVGKSREFAPAASARPGGC